MATTKVTPAPLTRTLHDVATEILADHHRAEKPLYFGAEPYVAAMILSHTTDLSDSYYDDDLDTVVLYALSNLQSWRGDTARRVKVELKAARAHHAIATHAPRD